MNALLLKILFSVARQLVGAFLGKLVMLIIDAEGVLVDNPGASKKEWVMTRLKEEAAWGKSYLASLPNVVVSALVDVVVASVKTSPV